MKTMESSIAKIFWLDGENRLNHTNPWSVWTRFATLPLLVLSIWARVWIWWYALIPICTRVFWLIINPTLFKKQKSIDNRWSKAVLWEKYWSERNINLVADHHKIPIHILTLLQVIWWICLAYWLVTLHMWFTIVGSIIIYISKMRFLDRMVWIYQEKKTSKAQK